MSCSSLSLCGCVPKLTTVCLALSRRMIVWIQMQEQINYTGRGIAQLMTTTQSQEVQTLQTHVKALSALFDDAEEILRLSEPEEELVKPASPTSVDSPAKPKEQPRGWTVNDTSDHGVATHDMLMERIRKMLKQPEPEAPNTKAHKRKSPAAASGSSSTTSSSPSAVRGAKHHRYAFSKSRLENYEAEKVLDVRGTRNSVRDYLVQWKGMVEPMWVPRRKCPDQAKELISAFSNARRAQSRRESQMLARGLLDPKAVCSSSHNAPNDIFIVDKIVDHKVRYGKKYYFVKWEGYADDDNTWERADKLRQEVVEVVNQYERERARKRALASSSNDNQRHQGESEDDVATEAKRLKRADENMARDLKEQESDDDSDMEFPFVQYDDQDLENDFDNAADELEEKAPGPTYRSVDGA